MQHPTVGLHVEDGDLPQHLSTFVGGDGDRKVAIQVGTGATLIGTPSALDKFVLRLAELVADVVAEESRAEEAAAGIADCRAALAGGRRA